MAMCRNCDQDYSQHCAGCDTCWPGDTCTIECDVNASYEDYELAHRVRQLANERDQTSGDVLAGDCPDLAVMLTPGAAWVLEHELLYGSQ